MAVYTAVYSASLVTAVNSGVEESSYFGYGMFGSVDAYEIVVDFNRDYLSDMFDTLERRVCKDHWGQQYRPTAEAYQNREDMSALDIPSDWKRLIGITISCEHNEWLPYPLKITRCKDFIPYDELFPSISTQ